MSLEFDVPTLDERLKKPSSLRELAPLRGLVLAGGSSSRMGRDKGSIEYHGVSQVLWLQRLLAELCESVYISINSRQRNMHPYCDLPFFVDQPLVKGPAAGLLAAWEAFPESAWLAVAVDLPLINRALLRRLEKKREPSNLATAYLHDSGVLEPVCTIYEPYARGMLVKNMRGRNGSLRRVLELGPTTKLPILKPKVLMSINTSAEYEDACIRLSSDD